MKVFFEATPSRLDEYKKVYRRIGDVIEHKNVLTSNWILNFTDDFFKLPREKFPLHYKNIKKALDKADVAVFDNSVSSTTIGQLIQHALLSKKPVIVLQDHNGTPSVFLTGAGDVESKLLLIEYNHSNLEQKLNEALDFVEDWLETRFTLILDGETRRLLDKATKKGVSRSEYIRNLIAEDMKRRLK